MKSISRRRNSISPTRTDAAADRCRPRRSRHDDDAPAGQPDARQGVERRCELAGAAYPGLAAARFAREFSGDINGHVKMTVREWKMENGSYGGKLTLLNGELAYTPFLRLLARFVGDRDLLTMPLTQAGTWLDLEQRQARGPRHQPARSQPARREGRLHRRQPGSFRPVVDRHQPEISSTGSPDWATRSSITPKTGCAGRGSNSAARSRNRPRISAASCWRNWRRIRWRSSA